MEEKLLQMRATLIYDNKEKQQDELFYAIVRMLVVEGHRIKSVKNEEEMFDAINKLNLEGFLGVVEGKHGPCMRPGCDYKSHANFFKSKETGIWLYKCPCCKTGRETITFAELVLEVFKRKYPSCNHRTIVRLIRRAFDVKFFSDFYIESERRLNYNMQKLREVDENSYLGKLIRKRKLEEFFEYYMEIAIMHLLENLEYEYSFYASRQVILEYFNEVKEQSKSNAIIEKVNLMAELGFITKLQPENTPTALREKVKFRKDDKVGLKDVSVYQVNTITDEQLAKAEEYAKAVICNKIYRNKVSLEDSIKETCSFTKEEEQFLNRANKAITSELNDKGYITLSSLVSKIDKKGKYYKKDEKEKLFNLLEDRIMLEANLKKIKATATNKKKYNMKRVKDKETILVKNDKELEIAPRIRVVESVRVAKKKKSETIIAKKKKSKAPTIVGTYMENGCTMAEMSDGTIDMIDIPF